MKKLLLSLATVAMAASGAFAEELTFDFVNKDYGMERRTEANDPYLDSPYSITDGDVTLYLTKSDAQTTTGFRLWKDGLRLTKTKDAYASISVEALGGTITGISMTTSKTFDMAEVSTSTAESSSMTYDQDSKTYTWTGEMTNPIIFVQNSSTVAISTLTVTYVPSGQGDLLPANLSFPEASYTVNLGDTFAAPELSKDTDAAVSYTSSDESVATVDATTGAVTIISAGTTTVTASAPATSTYREGSAHYTLNVVASYGSIKEFYTLPKDGTGIIGFDLVCAYQNGKNTYVTDGTDFSLIYGEVPTYNVGDIIPAGWEGKYTPYYNVPEIVPVTAPAESDECEEFTPAEVTTFDASMINHVIVLKGVSFATATPAERTTFEGTVDGNVLTFYNSFTIESVAEGTYDVTGAVSDFKGTPQLNVIAYNVVTGVDEINAAAQGEAQYFNLQGQRVENPANGLYIRVQNGKAEKLMVK